MQNAEPKKLATLEERIHRNIIIGLFYVLQMSAVDSCDVTFKYHVYYGFPMSCG